MTGNTFKCLTVGLVLLAQAATAQTPTVRVGVWNIEVLSATGSRGFPELRGNQALGPRTDADLKAIADYIKNEVKADALMVTEIDADAATSTPDKPQSAQLNKICSHLGNNWRYFLGRTGGKMRLGLLFNENRIQLKKLVNLEAEPFFVSGKDVFDRDPFIAWINVLEGGMPRNDLLLVCLHLKSQQQPFRHNRMAAVAKLLGDVTDKQVRAALTLPSSGEEPEMLILGDCNDSSHTASGFKFMFDYLNGVGFAHLAPVSGPYPRTRVNGSQIDHIFGSSSALSAMLADSFQVHTVPNTPAENAAYREVFSDHFPVTLDVRVQPDDDATLAEVLEIENRALRAQRLVDMTEEISALVGQEELYDDEDTEPVTVKAQVINDDFERILAPRVGDAPAPNADEQSAAPRRTIHVAADRSDGATLQKTVGMLSQQANLIVVDDAPSDDGELAFSTLRTAPGLKLYVPVGKSLPEELRSEVTATFQKYAGDAEQGRQLIVARTDREIVEDAEDSEDVAAIEIARPPTVGPAIPLVPFNREARMTHSVDELLSTFAGSHDHGASIRAAIFDGGRIRGSHQEFKGDDGNSRVEVHPSTTTNLSSHATHVCGTMGARGVKEKARGMAKRLRITSFDFRDDLNVLELAANQYRVSNHSYGPISGWHHDSTFGWEWRGDTTISPTEDIKFGKYGIDNRQLDDILHRNPELLTVVAAGNDRNDEPDNQPILHSVLAKNPATGQLVWIQSSAIRPSDGADHGGLDTVAGLGVSKNCLCIGAIHDITNSAEPILTTDFSSWGPTDDFRIKPDLSANGQDLFSASSGSDSAYLEMPGTSMASPTAAGIAAVLMEHFHAVKGRFPTSAEIKAIMIHSATDDATHPGPDPVYGWGSINALAAGELIAGEAGEWIETDEATVGDTKKWRFVRTSGPSRPVRATLVWTDPPAPPNTGGLDDSTPALVNDLDLEVVGPGNAAPIHPYSLNRGDPLSPATTTAANRVDNVEVIDAPSADGEWTIRVVPHTINAGTAQRFTLIVSGLTLANDDDGGRTDQEPQE